MTKAPARLLPSFPDSRENRVALAQSCDASIVRTRRPESSAALCRLQGRFAPKYTGVRLGRVPAVRRGDSTPCDIGRRPNQLLVVTRFQ